MQEVFFSIAGFQKMKDITSISRNGLPVFLISDVTLMENCGAICEKNSLFFLPDLIKWRFGCIVYKCVIVMDFTE